MYLLYLGAMEYNWYIPRSWNRPTWLNNVMLSSQYEYNIAWDLWRAFHWHHGIFGKSIMATLSKYSTIWLLLRGITLWTIWIERNDLTFNNYSRWDASKVKQTILQGLLDYARITWEKSSQRLEEGRPSMMMSLPS